MSIGFLPIKPTTDRVKPGQSQEPGSPTSRAGTQLLEPSPAVSPDAQEKEARIGVEAGTQTQTLQCEVLGTLSSSLHGCTGCPC